jgi:hypothetical protein
MPPMGQEAHLFARLHRLGVALAAAIFAVCLAIVVGTGSATAAPAVTVLGAAAPVPASCPQNCLVEARVTGFQTSIGNVANPFVVTERGKIVAWSIKLGAPTGEQIKFFDDEFGPSRAAIAILRPTSKTNPKYELVRQSPVEDLAPFFGSTTTFALNRPLKVKPRNVVALTMPTWTPAFAVSQPATSRWAASRKPTKKKGGCADKQGRANLAAGSPQTALKSTRAYGCGYKAARLLYSATFVKNPNAAAPKPKPKKESKQ